MPIPIDNKKEGGRNIYSAVDEEYHREVVGMSSGQPGNKVLPGNRVLEAMNGVTPGFSRIYPMTDFVNIVLDNNPFIWKLEHATKKLLATARILVEKNLY